MRRLNLAFLAVVLVAAAVGGATALQFRGDLGAVRTVVAVEDRVSLAVTGGTLTDRGLEVTARIDNPTGYRFRVAGGVVSSQNASGEGLASGPAERLDDNGSALPPKGSLSVRLLLRLSPTGHRRLAAAMAAGDVDVTVTVSVYYDEVRFSATGSSPVGGGA